MHQNPLFDYKEENGLVFCNLPSGAKNNTEILYIDEAKQLGIDAVFFRRHFRDGEEAPYKSDPSVCIFNKSDSFFNTNEHIILHASLWSSSNHEIYIIRGETRIDIINARKPAEFDSAIRHLSISKLVLARAAIEDFDYSSFSAHLFGSGTFWEQSEFVNQLDTEKTPHILLLNYLLKTRQSFKNNLSIVLSAALVDKLLIICILIKFLEEREDDEGKHTLNSIYFNLKVEGLADAISKGYFLDVINELAQEFNGKIFNKFTAEEKIKINDANLSPLANFLSAKVDVNTGQSFIWEQYDFKYLPAEIISSIYENFIQEDAIREDGKFEKGIVYTPIHLVNFLIDEAMPLDRPQLFDKEIFRVLDPSCGSGVFLVAAYKRLLQWWTINNSKNGHVIYPQSQKAIEILENNIYGVDIKGTATLVTIFGLTIALLDKLTPKEIWNNLKFSDLTQEKIQEADFFKWSQQCGLDEGYFDLVIGNPPFNPIKGQSKKDVAKDDQLAKFNVRADNIPRNNFALKFFEGAKYWGKLVCLILPANIFLYDKASLAYRKNVFLNYTVHKIFDFTHLRRDLFHKSADTPVVAVVLEKTISVRRAIEHIVVKRMLSSEKKIGFEIDYYDRYFVKFDWAIDVNNFFLWKANLLGGGRLFHFIYRLNLLPTLGQYVAKNVSNNGWMFNIGYIVGNSSQTHKASYLTNKNYILGFDDGNKPLTELELSETFEAPRQKFLFTPPYLLIKDVIGENEIPTYLIKYTSNEVLPFRRNFTGISAPPDDVPLLEEIYARFKGKSSKIFRFSAIVNSASVMVKQETYLNKEDIERLPYPEDEKSFVLSYTEEILLQDVLNYYVHLGKSISKSSAGYNLEKQSTINHLDDFGNVFCNILNERYKQSGVCWQKGHVISLNNYNIYILGFGPDGEINEVNTSEFIQEIPQTVNLEICTNTGIYKRIFRIYQHIGRFDCVFLIKPNTQRYWLRSIALRDADDTILDLQKEGF